MFLSRIAINPYLPEAREVLSNTQLLHAAVMGMFDAYSKDTSGKSTDRSNGTGVPLWRLDAAVDSLSLAVLSGDKPHTSDLAKRIGWDDGTDGAVVVADYSAFLDSLRNGQHYGFRTTVNMVQRSGGRVVNVAASPNAKLVWLAKAARNNGFRVVSIPEVTSVTDVFRKEISKSSRQVTLDKTTVNGHLEVLDADALRAAMSHGLGRGRAYGCGLLTLAAAE